MRISKRTDNNRKPHDRNDLSNTVTARTAFLILAGLTNAVMHRVEVLKVSIDEFDNSIYGLCIKAVDGTSKERRYNIKDVLCLRDCLVLINGIMHNTSYTSFQRNDICGYSVFNPYRITESMSDKDSNDIRQISASHLTYCINRTSSVLRDSGYHMSICDEGILLSAQIESKG